MKYVVDVKGELPNTGALSKAKKLTITSYMQSIIDDICDNYCKYPDICTTEEELFKHCDECPF